MVEGALLLISWLVCWYLMLVRYTRPTSVPVRDSVPYSISSYVLALTLGVWSTRMWLGGIYPPQGGVLVLAWLLVVAGQALLIAGRTALPLSISDLVLRLAARHQPQGVQRYVWHPMYIGLLLAVVGSSIVLNNGALFLCWFIGAALLLRAAAEQWG